MIHTQLNNSNALYNLKSLDPMDDLEDLSCLREWVGDACLVVLGEASHGSKEFFKLKHKIFRFLVEQMGFTSLTLEASWSQAMYIERVINAGVGHPNVALGNLFFWVWYSQELLDLIIWMKNYNATIDSVENKIRFSGFDILFTDASLDYVIDSLKGIDRSIEDRVKALYYDFRIYKDKFKYHNEKPDFKLRCRQDLLEVYDLIQRDRATLTSIPPAKIKSILQNARVNVQTEHYCSISPNTIESYLVRDNYMAENIAWLMENGPQHGKMVVWTHNSHAGNREMPPGYINMGAHLRKKYGHGMKNIGFSFYGGWFNAISPNASVLRNKPQVYRAPALPERSYEEYFQSLSLSTAIINLSMLKSSLPTSHSFPNRGYLRSIGSVYLEDHPEQFFYETNLAEEFDLMVFVPEITPSTLL